MRVRFLPDLSDGHDGRVGGREVFLRYCTVAGDEVATTWEQARADLIVEGLPMRVPPTYQGQRSYPGLFWAATNDRTLVYESLLELDRLWLADRYSACFPAEHLSELDRPDSPRNFSHRLVNQFRWDQARVCVIADLCAECSTIASAPLTSGRYGAQ